MNTRLDTAPNPQRRYCLRAAAFGLAALSAGHAGAQRPALARILCSGPGGSIPDLVARSVAEPLSAPPGARVLVDNRPGAAGRLSIAALKAAPHDGSTLLLAQGAIATVYPALYDPLGYDPLLDLQPVSLAAEMLLGLALGPAVPPEVVTLAGFVDWARHHPDATNIGSPGTGTLPHLLSAMLFHETGVGWQHVAFSGGPPAVTALLGGQIAALVLPEGLLRPHVASGRLRVLATSGPTRSSTLPGVPSFAEQGHADLVMKEWFAFFAPGRTPKALVASLSSDLQRALAQPGVAGALQPAGMTPAWSTPQALAARISDEQRLWQPVLRARGIRAD